MIPRVVNVKQLELSTHLKDSAYLPLWRWTA